METRSLKALSILRLQGNIQGNIKETSIVKQETVKETSKSFPVSLCRDGNRETSSTIASLPSLHPEASGWRPESKAWLTDTNELRTQGVFDDLAGEIIRLTADNLPLQKKLLRERCSAYSGPQWKYLVEEFEHLAAKMTDTDITQHDAELAAAKHLRIEAFLDELILDH